jgi:ribosomal protection tetracycline resistance protein
MTRTSGLGTKAAVALPEPLDSPEIAEALAETDERVLARVVDGPPLTAAEVADALAAGTAAGRVHPLYAGSAMSGAGIPALLDGIVRLLPPAPVVAAVEPRGTVFAVERTPSGEKLAYLRLFAGEVRPRQRVVIRRRHRDGGCEDSAAQVTSLRVVGRNGARRLTAGDIGRLGGLEPKVGDRIGLGTRPTRAACTPRS